MLDKISWRSHECIYGTVPYRYVECGTLDNGFPDYRIQKEDYYTKRYRDMYLCDNSMQLTTAIEDFEYTKWLDPEGVPAYRKSN